MSWWKTDIEGKMKVITIYSFHWRMFFILLFSGIFAGLLLIALVWLKSLVH